MEQDDRIKMPQKAKYIIETIAGAGFEAYGVDFS